MGKERQKAKRRPPSAAEQDKTQVVVSLTRSYHRGIPSIRPHCGGIAAGVWNAAEWSGARAEIHRSEVGAVFNADAATYLMCALSREQQEVGTLPRPVHLLKPSAVL